MALCRPRFGPAAYDAMLAFTRRAVIELDEVVVSVVGSTLSATDLRRCHALAEELGAELRSLGTGRLAFETLADEDSTALLRAVRRAAPIVLLIGAGESGPRESEIEQLRRGLRCPMLVAR